MSSFIEAVRLFGRDGWHRYVTLVIVVIIASGFEVIGAALVFVLLGLVADPTASIDLPLLGDPQSWLPMQGTELLLALIAMMAAFFLVRGVVHVAKLYVQFRIVHNASARLASDLVRGYLRMPYPFHLQRSSSLLIRNGHQAVGELVSKAFTPVATILAEAVLVASMLGLLVVLAPSATALAVLVVGGASLILILIVQPKLRRIGGLSHEMNRETLEVLQQSLHGIRDIKLLGRENSFAKRYSKSRLRLARASYISHTFYSLPTVVMELALLGFILAVFGFALIDGEEATSILPVLGLFGYAGLRLQPSLQRIVTGFNHLKFATASLADITHDLSIVAAEQAPSRESVEPLSFEHALQLHGVSFRYEGASEFAIRDVDLTIEPGESVGICGPTGGGKTTLVDLMIGLLAPTHGSVTVDGCELRGLERRWQRNLGVVSQMIFLTDQTLRENIALGSALEEIDDEALAEAVERAQLGPVVDELPSGLDTVVGERGVRLSGGQRQRVAIARALYVRPAVLVFDEGTSALDNTTERELMSQLETLRGDRTLITIAHRLSTVRSADRIIVMESGQISGLGTYDELMTSSRAFQALSGN